ncbi:hypothetical protein [Streptomyces sp. SJL17-1]|uniref:hypothetical protein n=1 Tax=Streptomyces sp. SJL17-1 TaxID=2967223 RepID=UPI0029668035|nr:hypothetical protein [Streptomyces sp. SJL17-1]
MLRRTRAAPAAGLAGSLLREVRAEPGRLPESLASFALRHLGPGAGPTVARLREAHPEADAVALRALITARGRRAVTTEGAFVGGPFLLLIPLAFCGALLTQVRTVLEIAAAEGRDSTDPQRAAELLVLQGVYGDTETARAALDPAGSRPGSGGNRPGSGGGRGRVAAFWDLIGRMTRVLGLVTPDGGAGLWVRIGRWAILGAVFLVGLVAPLVWLPYMAVGYYRGTTRLTDRATAFYVGSPDPPSSRSVRLDPVMARAGLRAAGSVLLPTVTLILVIVTDVRIADGRWPVVGIVLTTSCLVSGGWWLWRHYRRRS